MPSGTDFFNQLKDANKKLDDLNATTSQVRADVEQLTAMLSANFNQLLTFTAYTNQALYQNALQNDTIICILERISKQTCELLNQACVQTALQRTMQTNSTALAELFAATHPEAALIRAREEALRNEIEKCCPPKPPAPCCRYEKCPSPEPLPPPPGGGVIE